jgi:AAA domain
MQIIKPFEEFDVATLRAMPQPVQAYVIDPIVPRPGITLLHGRWGTGKTPVLVTEAVCVATGQPFLGLPVTQGPVLIIEADMTKSGFRARFWGVIQRLADAGELVATNRDDQFVVRRLAKVSTQTGNWKTWASSPPSCFVSGLSIDLCIKKNRMIRFVSTRTP